MITALLFARLREQAGTSLERLDLAGSTVEEVYRALRERHPALEPDLGLVRPARNQEFADWSEAVADGDEVAFIPPVSGGSGPGSGAGPPMITPHDLRRDRAGSPGLRL